jgi:hypothetical protein
MTIEDHEKTSTTKVSRHERHVNRRASQTIQQEKHKNNVNRFACFYETEIKGFGQLKID